MRSHTHKEEHKRKKKKKKKQVKVASTKSGPSRISSYDYRSWDKFDVVSERKGGKVADLCVCASQDWSEDTVNPSVFSETVELHMI